MNGPLGLGDDWRDNLTSAQAERLRRWATSLVQGSAGGGDTFGLSGENGMEWVAVRSVLASVNELMGTVGLPAESIDIVPGQVADDANIRLRKNLRWLSGQRQPAAARQALRQFNEQRPKLGQNEAFELLFAAIQF